MEYLFLLACKYGGRLGSNSRLHVLAEIPGHPLLSLLSPLLVWGGRQVKDLGEAIRETVKLHRTEVGHTGKWIHRTGDLHGRGLGAAKQLEHRPRLELLGRRDQVKGTQTIHNGLVQALLDGGVRLRTRCAQQNAQLIVGDDWPLPRRQSVCNALCRSDGGS